MLAGISHDLRTPLTRMKLGLAMMHDAQEVRDLNADVAQMEHMIEEYLDFARGGGGEESAPYPLGELLEEIVADYRRVGQEVGLSLEEELVLEVRRGAFRRMLHNVVDNALRHGEHCMLTARRVAGKAEILLDDDGPGIPMEQREEVFRPFTRLDEARNLNSGGVGLGLSIARDIAQAHGGDIALDTSPMGGLRAIIRLPL
jgi:two-component system osmolarity sensor histidine kinase EnvZ